MPDNKFTEAKLQAWLENATSSLNDNGAKAAELYDLILSKISNR
jgi:hypothetical protein